MADAGREDQISSLNVTNVGWNINDRDGAACVLDKYASRRARLSTLELASALRLRPKHLKLILVISEHPECLYYFVRPTHTHLVTFHLDIP